MLPQGYSNYNEEDIYSEVPKTVQPYAAGELIEAFLQDGLNSANLVRYLAYLPADLELNKTLNSNAQHGATLLAAIGKLTHFPNKPDDMDQDFYNIRYSSTSSSNIGAGYTSLVHSIVSGYMRNTDEGNLRMVGHRRWILNPPLKQIGFGFASGNLGYGRYTAMQVFDRSRTEAFKYDFTAWPSQKAFPLECFSGRDPWSISLNPAIYDKSRVNEISMMLIRMAK